jgi:hypothetical protein
MSYHCIGCDCWDCYADSGPVNKRLVEEILSKAEASRSELSGKSLERMSTVIGLLRRIIEDGGK